MLYTGLFLDYKRITIKKIFNFCYIIFIITVILRIWWTILNYKSYVNTCHESSDVRTIGVSFFNLMDKNLSLYSYKKCILDLGGNSIKNIMKLL